MASEELFKLFLSVMAGGLIGFERKFRFGMGLRTMMLVSLGATLFTIYSEATAPGQGDPRRISAAVVSGVGFLGAGMILKEEGRVLGLTTAAAIWVVAAIGMGIGSGFYWLAMMGTLLAFVVLWGVPRLTRRLEVRYAVTYRATCLRGTINYETLTQRFRAGQLLVNRSSIAKSGEHVIYSWHVYGDPERHEAVEKAFVDDPAILSFEVE